MSHEMSHMGPRGKSTDRHAIAAANLLSQPSITKTAATQKRSTIGSAISPVRRPPNAVNVSDGYAILSVAVAIRVTLD